MNLIKPIKNNTFQIIGGKYKGRKFDFPDANGLRPTPNKVRETLFNWLQFEIVNKTCLDLFAGSGALGFEALSRGAKKVVSVEKNYQVFQNLTQNQKILSTNKLEIIHQNAIKFLEENTNKTFDFIFLDPPFNENLISETLKLLINFIDTKGKIYIESEYKITTKCLPKIFKIYKQKQSGQVFYCLVELLKL